MPLLVSFCNAKGCDSQVRAATCPMPRRYMLRAAARSNELHVKASSAVHQCFVSSLSLRTISHRFDDAFEDALLDAVDAYMLDTLVESEREFALEFALELKSTSPSLAMRPSTPPYRSVPDAPVRAIVMFRSVARRLAGGLTSVVTGL